MNEFGQRVWVALLAESQLKNRKLHPEEVQEVSQRIYDLALGDERAVWMGEQKKPRAKKVSEMSDEEWVVSLEGEPHLKGINIRKEIGAAQFWCRNNKRLPTRRFLINWLNKAERVVDLKNMGAQHATGLKPPAPAGPEGWKAWVKIELDTLSMDAPGASQATAAFNCDQFSMLPASWQGRCRAAQTAQGMTSEAQHDAKVVKFRTA